MLRACLLVASSACLLLAAYDNNMEKDNDVISFIDTSTKLEKKQYEKGVIPITKNAVTLTIPIGSFSIFSFPFEIVDLTKSVNGGAYDAIQSQDVDLSSLNNTQQDEQQQQQQSKPIVTNQSGNYYVERGKNTITVFPKEQGELKFIVWRAEGFPVQFDVKIGAQDEGLRYYEFVEPYGSDNKDAKAFEANEHESVISELIKASYNRKPIEGYKVYGTSKKKDIAGLRLINVSTFVGDAYAVQEWNVKNLTDATIKLYEEMFYEPGIYAVSFENDTLEPNEACRMFVVRKADGV